MNVLLISWQRALERRVAEIVGLEPEAVVGVRSPHGWSFGNNNTIAMNAMRENLNYLDGYPMPVTLYSLRILFHITQLVDKYFDTR